jgi:O-antigen chain-terminating methyltransferase
LAEAEEAVSTLQLETAQLRQLVSLFSRDADQLSRTSTWIGASEGTEHTAPLVSDSIYAYIEERIRGSRREILSRLEGYLPLIRDLDASGAPALDIGCGRGEWLELLARVGIPTEGIEPNRIFAEECRGRGLDVRCVDALTTLRGLPTGTVPLVTTFHVLEHLAFPEIVRVMREVLRVLAPGGLFICETPNPGNVTVATQSFWLDPTHRRPLPPLTLQLLAHGLGYCRVSVRPLTQGRHAAPTATDSPSQDGRTRPPPECTVHDAAFLQATDYALVAHKTSSETWSEAEGRLGQRHSAPETDHG